MDFPYTNQKSLLKPNFYEGKLRDLVITLSLLELNEDYKLILLTGKFENGSNY